VAEEAGAAGAAEAAEVPVASRVCPKHIDAYVSIDGRDLGEALIAAGLGRPYAGGKRAG
jgi:endonuclease YncB( thermonuclease family)